MEPFICQRYCLGLSAHSPALHILFRRHWLYLADDHAALTQPTLCQQLLFLAHRHNVSVQVTHYPDGLLLVIALDEMLAFIQAIQAHFPVLANRLRVLIAPIAQAA